MTSVFDWWAIGVRNEDAAPTLTVIRKGSTDKSSVFATPKAIGAIKIAAALLVNRLDKIIVIVIKIPSKMAGEK